VVAMVWQLSVGYSMDPMIRESEKLKMSF